MDIDRNEIIRREEQEDGYPPENIFDLYGQLLHQDSKNIFEHLIKDMSNGNLTKEEVLWCQEGLSIMKFIMKMKGVKYISIREENKSGFEFTILHEVLSKISLSLSVNMKGRELYFTQKKQSQYEFMERDKRRRLLGMK